MSLRTGALRLGRRMAVAGLLDTCRITRTTGKVWNEATKRNEETTIQVYEGPCSLLSPYRAPTTADTAGQSQRIELARLKLPVETSAGISKGDVVEYLTSASDPDLPGRRFTVAVGSQQSDTTTRRVPVEEYS